MYRDIKLARRSARTAPDAIAVLLFQQTPALPEAYQALDQQMDGLLRTAMQRSEFNLEAGAVTTLYPAPAPGSKPAPGSSKRPERVFVCGLGNREAFDANALRIAAAKLVRSAFAARVQRLEVLVMPALADQLDAEQAGSALGDGLAIAGFEFEQFKGSVNRPDEPVKPIDLALHVEPALQQAMTRSLTIGRGVTTARRLAATPPNVANPPYIVSECRKLARQTGLKITVIDEEKAEQLGMGGLVAVGKGGSEPPALICLEHRPKAARAGKGKGKKKTVDNRPILLVGKAVTFDTGGYSLKPPTSMAGMKYDKCGGMNTLGIMQAVAELDLPVPVVALLPVVENMVDDDAYRVDDILTMVNGVTVEVTNTDAEGRLILADALAYGTKQYDPRAVLDMATLTGGVVVALGSFCAGLWCNDDDLRSRLDAAALTTGEKLWRLPLWEEHRQQMKGTHADLLNSSPDREAHPIQGAAFLSYFVGKDAPKKLPTLPWAHLDIAGTAALKKDTPLYPKGPTGFGVRLVVEMLRTWE